MNSSISTRRLIGLVMVAALALSALGAVSLMAQSRRQPPSSDQKKNKRPDNPPPDEQKPEPVPTDVTGKPQEAEKITTTTNLVNVQPVIGSYTLAGLSALSAGGTDHLRIKLLLPSGAGNSFQGLSSTLGYVFTATQRAAASK